MAQSDIPWDPSARGVDAVVDLWLGQGRVRPQVALDEELPASKPSFGPMPSALTPGLTEALAAQGIDRLYQHQSQAISHALNREHVVIATPTSSGKSLCFHLPVLDAIAKDSTASALYLFPTKALSRDQEVSLQSTIGKAGLDIGAMVFDGDTPGDARKAVRERARIVLSNPDMLHAGILPNHAKWSAFFESLKYVVLDEMHTYRGVFGSHMAHVVARLKRIAAFHGASPTFICATATIGNPGDHCARLLGVTQDAVHVIDKSGAPASERQLLVYNPPIVNAEMGVRASSLKHAVSLATDLISARVPTILFGESRNSVELMLKYLRDACPDVPQDGIVAYRGGYLPETRRRIERGLRSGEILCVAATNALELGIDIGDLDAVICVGYPGTVASTWQRFGRAGRRGRRSIALLVCSNRALDQYLARQPDHVLKGSAEEARIDPENAEILIQHLKCAAFEAPFAIRSAGARLAEPQRAEGENYGPLGVESTRAALEYLGQQGLITQRGDAFYWAGEAYPASHVSLRNIGWDNFVIIDVENERNIAELDWRATHTMLHEQAIYQHDAEQYQVERLDFDNHKAYVRKVKPDYFTTALTYRDVEVLEEFERGNCFAAIAGFGEVKVIEKVTGFKKIKYGSHENTGFGEVHLPEMQMHTTSFWLTLPDDVLQTFNEPRSLLVDALRCAGQALETIAALALMCEPQDINRTLGEGYQDGEQLPAKTVTSRPERNPTIFLFDAQPGGVGLAQRMYQRRAELVERAQQLIQTCPCEAGCPACIGPHVGNGTLKRIAAQLLERCAG